MAVPEAAGPPPASRVDQSHQKDDGEDEAADGDPDDGAHGDGIGDGETDDSAELAPIVLRHEVVGAIVAGGHGVDRQLGGVAVLPGSQQYIL